jgi:hypothetical protein
MSGFLPAFAKSQHQPGAGHIPVTQVFRTFPAAALRRARPMKTRVGGTEFPLSRDSMGQSLPDRKRLSRPHLWISYLISTGIVCAELSLFAQAKMLSRFTNVGKRQKFTGLSRL